VNHVHNHISYAVILSCLYKSYYYYYYYVYNIIIIIPYFSKLTQNLLVYWAQTTWNLNSCNNVFFKFWFPKLWLRFVICLWIFTVTYWWWWWWWWWRQRQCWWWHLGWKDDDKNKQTLTSSSELGRYWFAMFSGMNSWSDTKN
jgi:hypothetical protein